jgi:squalene-hopene/tetraprenyl-beta-curcumene cyclase
MKQMNAWLMCGLTLLMCEISFGEGERRQEAQADDKPYKEGAMRSINSGLDWLKSIQKDNGSWSNENFPAMTALGLWAFTRSDHPDKATVCAKAAAFVAGFVQPDGGIYKPATGGRGSGGMSTYNTAICMTALHAYDKATYTPVILKAREFVAGSQLLGDSGAAGGFGYNHPSTQKRGLIRSLLGRKPRSDLSNTGWSLMAMRYTQDVEDLRPTGETVDVDWDAALEFITKLQDSDADDPVNYGGFSYEPAGERGKKKTGRDGTVKLVGFGSMTYAGLESMIYAQVDQSDPRVRSALAWASRHWSVEENPGMGSRGLYYYYNVMGKALDAAGIDVLPQADTDKPAIPWRQQIVEQLAANQREDGSWVNDDSRFWEGDAMLVTAYSILTLEYALGL